MLVAACLLLLLSSEDAGINSASPHRRAGRILLSSGASSGVKAFRAGERIGVLLSSTEDDTNQRAHGEKRDRHLSTDTVKVFHTIGRLGNHMREWASGIGLAHRNGLDICSAHGGLDLAKCFKGPFPVCTDGERTGVEIDDNYEHNDRLFRFPGEERSDVSIGGYQANYQSFADVRDAVVESYTLLDENKEAALKFLEPYQNKIKIGIHVRRGDKEGVYDVNGYGMTPTSLYFADAIARARQDLADTEQGQLAFFISSDSIDWCKEQEVFQSEDIHFIENMDFLQDSVIFDFAVLMQMDHFILSEGTFGWWAAWLGAWQRGGTVYHSGKNDADLWVDNNGIPGFKAVDGDSHAFYFSVLGGATE